MKERLLMDTIAVLIPCYNEAKTIGKVVADFKKALLRLSFMFTTIILLTAPTKLPERTALLSAMNTSRQRRGHPLHVSGNRRQMLSDDRRR